jgi:prepilin-type N-terminal cleavage/methylation domain-containing protein
MSVMRARLAGFSLLEMAVVLVIVGLLLGGLLTSMSAMQARRHEETTRHQLDDIREALIVFAVVNRRLPCPADPATPDTVAGAGLERTPTAAGCTGGILGVLPWATLGLPQTDAWGRRFTYRVSATFARTAPAITLASTGDATVENASLVATATQVPVVYVSHGADAAGSRNSAGAQAPAGTNPLQQENADGDAVFVADTPTNGYDDLVGWVPATLLLGRMLQAGVLP